MDVVSLRNVSLEQLVALFELTEKMNDAHIPTVRGWLMDAIAEKNPDGFDRWLDSESCSDSELRKCVL